MPRRVPIPLEFSGAPFRSAEVDGTSISRRRLRSPDVAQPFRGANVVGAPPSTLVDRANALAVLLRPGDAFSHTTAAAILGAPLPRIRDSALHVTSLGGVARTRRPGVVGHRATSLPRTLHLGLPIVEPAYAWFQLATVLGHDDLVAVGDYLVTPNRRRKTSAIASIEALAAAIPDHARGASRARRALADVRVGAESPMETLLRLLLIRSGLPEPRLNPPLRFGHETLHPDLLYEPWRVVLEYEGDQHRTDARQWREDIRRREVFEDAGWRVIRVTSDDVLKEPQAFLARVCRILAQRQAAQRSGTLDPRQRDFGRLSE